MEEKKRRETEENPEETTNCQDSPVDDIPEEPDTAEDTEGKAEIRSKENTAEKQDPVDDLKRELEEYKEKSRDYYNQYLRAVADLDNYRKRVIKEREETYKDVACEILGQFLGVLDNLQRASQSVNTGTGCKGCSSIEEGINMVVKQFEDILAKFGVEEIPAEGKKFDPNYHYAVMQAEATGEEEGQIVEVLQKGYMLNSRILRPSMVKVAK